MIKESKLQAVKFIRTAIINPLHATNLAQKYVPSGHNSFGVWDQWKKKAYATPPHSELYVAFKLLLPWK
jgi:hypothetical protein